MTADTKKTSRFKGINNVTDPLRLSLGWLRKADNIDISDTGAISRRDGYTKKFNCSITWAYSMRDFDRMYIVDGGNLKRVYADLSTRTLRTGLSVKPMHWAEINDTTYYTNGVDSGVIAPNDDVTDWAWAEPATPNLATSSGSLMAGTYQVALTYVLPDGRETGAGASASITIAANQSLQITGISHVTGYTTLVYIAPANSTVFQLAFSTTLSSATWNDTPDNLGIELTTMFFDSLPTAATNPVFWQGRAYAMEYIASESITVIWISEPMGFHLFDLDDSFITVPGRGTLLTAADSGLVIGTDARVYSYDGEKLDIVAEYGAVPGYGAVQDDDNKTLFWTTRGLCSALPFANLTLRQISVPPGVSAGAVIIRSGGDKRYVVALQKGGTSFNQHSNI